MSHSSISTTAPQTGALSSLPASYSSFLETSSLESAPDVSNQKARSVAFVDTRLDQVEQLIAGIEADQIVLIDAQQNGVEQITQTLSQHDSLSSVHIFSHGSSGSLQLGNTSLTTNSLSRYSEQLSQWGDALLGEADLMLYGCNFASDDSGIALAQQISNLTGADVAASNDTTGASSSGGDWQLETHIGDIRSAIALNLATQATYAGTLDLLTNGGFEAGLSPWELFSGNESISSTAFEGSQSIQLSGAASGAGQIVDATPGDEFSLSLYARTNNTGYVGAGLNFFDASYNLLDFTLSNEIDIDGNAWTQYEQSSVAPDDTRYVQVWLYQDNFPDSPTDNTFIDDISLTVSSDPIDDTAAPTATLVTNTLTASGDSSLGFTVTYSDETAVDISSLDNADIRVTGPGGFAQNATFVEVDSPSDGSPRTATYRLGEPSDGWQATNDGTYTVRLKSNQVGDTLGNQNSAIDIGTFEVSVSSDSGELLTNGGFEAGIAPWELFSGNEAISSSAFEGSQSIQLSGAASGAGQIVDATPGDEFSLSLYARTNNTGYVGAGLNFFDASYNLLDFTLSNEIDIDGNAWTQYEQSSVAPDDTRYVQVWLYQDNFPNSPTDNTFIDNISLSVSDDGGSSNFGNISLAASNVAVSEGDGTATLTVVRENGSDGAITVDYGILSGSATADVDFTPVSGTLAFADGETEKTVEVAILDDSVAEGTESFGFAIDNVNGGATLLAPRTATVTISDDDAATYRGNQYLLATEAKTWEEAQAEAESLGGNLVTINAPAEETWLKDTFGTSDEFWIGLTDKDTEGTFEWASGEAVLYTNWAPGEPNNGNAGQDYVQMNFSGSKQWDDLSGSELRQGIIEIGGNNGPGGLDEGDGNGLLGEYYDNIDFTNPVLSRTDATVDFDWGTGSPDADIGSDTFSVRWSGRIEPRFSEAYTFQTTTDEGVRLFVDDQLIIDQFVDQTATSHTGTITLVAGEQYNIRMEYYEREGAALAQLAWSSDSQPLQIVPQSQLYSDPPQSEVLSAETVVSGLIQPTSIEWQPNTDRMFISEKAGVVKIFENGALNAEPFIDISDQVNGVRDRGLLDIAIHPDFPNTPYVYLLYTYDPPEVFDYIGTEAGPDGKNNRAGRLTRVTADASTNYTTAVPGSEVILLGTNSTWDNFNGFANSTDDFDEPPAGVLPDGSYVQDILVADSESHTVGGLEFGIDGALYVTNGDGASYNRVDPRATRVQDIDSLSGKVLRIDPITGAGFTDNPFYDGDVNSNRSKVYQYGLRNPFRITIDEDNGNLYIGEVGLSAWEEINSAALGANFGWPYYEGGDGESLQTGGYNQLPEAIAFYNSGEPVEPALRAFSHSETGINAIVLGDIYTGDAYPDKYKGDLFFNDLGQGIVRNVSLDASGNVTDIETFTTGAEIVVHIEEGPDGALYYTDLADGEIGRWVFSEEVEEDLVIAPSLIPPLAKPSVLTPIDKPAGSPDFFLAP